MFADVCVLPFQPTFVQPHEQLATTSKIRKTIASLCSASSFP